MHGIVVQVDPMEVWLRDESDDSGYFPESEDGISFNLSGISPFATMIVEGPLLNGFPPRAQGSTTRGQSLAMASTSSSVKVASGTPPPPMYRSVVAPKRVAITVKIVKARIKMPKKGSGNPEFESLSQMYVELTDATANIAHVTDMVRKQWGTEYYIVSAEGIEIADSAATQGE